MKLYTKGGDKGRTSLIGGERVRKTDVRVEAYGTADELQANIAYLADRMAHEEVLLPYVEDCRKICSLLMTTCSLLAVGCKCEYKIPAEGETKYMLSDVAKGKVSLDDFIAQLTDEEMMALLIGKPNTGVANTDGMGGLEKYGIPAPMTVDGPAGVRIKPSTGVFTTAFPVETMLACSWNLELVERIGVAAALETKENNLSMWLAPALNIHRSPLCGRNFEYFSEDPYVSGKMAAAVIRGTQSQNIVATAKHFACNN